MGPYEAPGGTLTGATKNRLDQKGVNLINTDDHLQEDTISRRHHLKDGQHLTDCPSITTWSAHHLDDASTSDAGTTITIIVWGHTKPLAAS